VEVPPVALEELDPKAVRKILDKAAWLIETGRVVKISDYMFYVMGRRNRHIVKIEDGKLVCTCPGYRSKNVCSHVVAVMFVLEMKGGIEYIDEKVRRRVLRELRTLWRGGTYR